MEVLFDLCCTQPNGSGRRHGGGKYGEIIFRRIVERGLPVVALYDSSRWFNPEIRDFLINNQVQVIDITKKGSIKKVIENYNFKRLYSPLLNSKLLHLNLNIDIVGTIHDLRAMELSFDKMMLKYNTCPYRKIIAAVIKKYWKNLGYSRARAFYLNALHNKHLRFIMVSNHSLSALLAYFPQFKEKNIKAYYSPSTITHSICSKKYEDKYYLMVSANRWEKNCLRAIMAFDRLISYGFLDNTKVRITGAESIKDYRYKLKNSQCFEFMGYVDELELSQLYHDAYGFVYPSLNEGFGYPPLEAMHYGVPCIVSPFTSIPEICQGAAIYTNPYSIEEIMSRIILLENPDIHKKFSLLAINQERKIKRKQNDDLDKAIDFIYQ